MTTTPTPELFGSKYDEAPYTYGEDTEPCAHCARPVTITRPYWAIEYDGQGFYALGPECRKLFPDAIRVEGVTKEGR